MHWARRLVCPDGGLSRASRRIARRRGSGPGNRAPSRVLAPYGLPTQTEEAPPCPPKQERPALSALERPCVGGEPTLFCLIRGRPPGFRYEGVVRTTGFSEVALSRVSI